MKTISHPLFIVIASMYLVYYALKHSGIVLPLFFTNYFADLVSVFVLNTIALFCVRKLFGRPNFELSLTMITSSFLLTSLFFEVILPRQSSYYVADVIDVFCYLISALTYYLWRKLGYSKGY